MGISTNVKPINQILHFNVKLKEAQSRGVGYMKLVQHGSIGEGDTAVIYFKSIPRIRLFNREGKERVTLAQHFRSKCSPSFSEIPMRPASQRSQNDRNQKHFRCRIFKTMGTRLQENMS
ncbi:hypothetical protein NE237_006329 [Protea cynaroides]|uniref:Uncharacterized protein n=1 Tax=Protea cynaroides TaxID=273540 RepID=A0A9Q0QVB7_9MAGN|nr:hypothetical protein NE237_006329 [Protea cynaroides]